MEYYLLTKEYPGSPKIGTIKMANSFGIISARVNMHNVKKYSEYWKKVVSTVEILDFRVGGELIPIESCRDTIVINSVRRLSDREIISLGDTGFYNTVGEYYIGKIIDFRKCGFLGIVIISERSEGRLFANNIESIRRV